jgi:hypothetical protein
VARERPQPQRSPYEVASVVFGAIIVLFGVWGAVKSAFDGPGVGSEAFVISVVFVALGAGRVVLGLRVRGR